MMQAQLSASHHRIWAAIDAFAAAHGLTPCGMARCAGLNTTTFNKSKRFSPTGATKWPTTHSIAKVLVATNKDVYDFVKFIPKK